MYRGLGHLRLIESRDLPVCGGYLVRTRQCPFRSRLDLTFRSRVLPGHDSAVPSGMVLFSLLYDTLDLAVRAKVRFMPIAWRLGGRPRADSSGDICRAKSGLTRTAECAQIEAIYPLHALRSTTTNPDASRTSEHA